MNLLVNREVSQSRSNRSTLIALLFLPCLTAALLYLPSLGLPIIYDDLLHIRIANDLTLWTVWLPTEAFGFYRPMTFVPLLLIEKIWGYYPAALLHGLNIAQHGLNAALLAALTWRLWGKWDRALIAGLLFAFFPFSYQAVAVYGHNVHPAITGLILLGLLAYLEAIRGGKGWRPLVALCLAIALLTHETAVLFGPFAALIHWAANDERPTTNDQRPISHASLLTHHFSLSTFNFSLFTSRLLRQPWLWLTAVGAAYFLLYQFLPISRAPQTAVAGESIWAELWTKGLYLGQAASYPLAGALNQVTNWPGAAVVGLSFGLTILLTIFAIRNRARRRPLALAWGWWGLAGLVIALPLPTGYLLHGPRLLYLSSVGLAWLWALLLETNDQRLTTNDQRLTTNDQRLTTNDQRLTTNDWRLTTRWLAAGLVGGLLIWNSWFVYGRLQQYQQLTEPVRVIQATMADQPADQGVTAVNLPEWLSPPQNVYPVGVELVAMLGPYLFAEELFHRNLRQDRPVQTMILPDQLENLPYPYGLHQRQTAAAFAADWAPAGSHLFITHYRENGLETVYAGSIEPAAPTGDYLADMGAYRLLAAEVEWQKTAVALVTTWQILPNAQPAPTHSLFVQALSADGRLIAQLDGPPLRLRPDLLTLPAGWQIIDRRQLTLPEPPVMVLLGVYDYANGERLTAVDATGQPLPNNALNLRREK